MAELGADAFGEVEVLVVAAALASAVGRVEEAHVPGGIHGAVADFTAEVGHDAGQVVAVAGWIVRQGRDFRTEFWGEALVGVEVELLGVAQG